MSPIHEPLFLIIYKHKLKVDNADWDKKLFGKEKG